MVFAAGGVVEYCGRLDDWPSLDPKCSEIKDLETPDLEAPTSSSEPVGDPALVKTKVSAKDESVAKKRQTGDWHDWHYYGKAIGTWPLIMAFVFVSTTVFATSFPSMSP